MAGGQRVLCLHPFCRDGASFRQQVAHLLPHLPPGTELVCQSSPRGATSDNFKRDAVLRLACCAAVVGARPCLLGMLKHAARAREWFNASDPAADGTCVFRGLEHTLSWLLDFVRSCGPLDGMIGTSQGANVAAGMLAEHPRLCADAGLKWAVFVVGCRPRTTEYVSLFESLGADAIGVSTCHIIGERDPVKGQSDELVAPCGGKGGGGRARVLVADAGHRIAARPGTPAGDLWSDSSTTCALVSDHE